MEKQLTNLDEVGEDEQETEITFIHTLPLEIIEKLRERLHDKKDYYREELRKW